MLPNGLGRGEQDLKSVKQKLFFNMGTTFSRQVGVTVFQLLFTMLLARTLGKENYGIYALALMLPQLLMKVLNMGIGPSIVYYIARKELSFSSAFKKILFICFWVSLLGLATEVLVIKFFSASIFPGIPPKLLLIAAILFPLLLLQELLPNLLLGIQKFNAYNLSYSVLPSVSLAMAWILLRYVGVEVEYALAAFAAGHVVSTLWLILVVTKNLSLIEDIPGNEVSWKELITYSGKVHLSNIIGFLNYRIDMFLVNLLGSPATVGIYFIAVQIVEKLWLLSQAVNTAIFPHLAEKYKRNSRDTSVTEVLGSATFIVTAVISLILAFIGSYIIKLFFGVEYLESAPVLIILLPGILANSVGRILSNDFAARGIPQINLYVGFLTVTTNVVANIYLIPRMGAEGAALATSISYGLNLVIKLSIYYYLVKVPFWRVLLPGSQTLLIVKELFQNRSKTKQDGK